MQLRKFRRAMANFNDREEFDLHLQAMKGLDENWCKDIIQVKLEIESISYSTADVERLFSVMNRVKSKGKNSIGTSLGHRIRTNIHAPKDLKLIDWDRAYALWMKKKESRYATNMDGTKRFKSGKQVKGLQMSLLE